MLGAGHAPKKLTSEFGQVLEELVIPPVVLDWVQERREVARSMTPPGHKAAI
jgi:hypothetical protein